jgi:tetratricopeptide (TPR) repeat protein
MFSAIPLWLRLGFAFVLLLSGFLWWKVPQWRTEKVMERVEAAVEAREFETAQEELRSLIQRHPRLREPVLRLASLLRATDPAEAFAVLRDLHRAGRLPEAQYPNAVLLGYEVGEVEAANAMLAAIETDEANLARLSGPNAIRSLLSGDFFAGRNQLDEALALFPDWNQVRFIRAQLMSRSPSKVDQLRAKEDLLRVAEGRDFDAVRALIALVDANNLAITNAEKHAHLGRLLEHPWAPARLRLLAHHYRWVLDPEKRAREVEAAIADLGQTHGVILAEWMNAIGEHERALEFVPAGTLAETDRAAFEQRFRALALGGRFAEAEELVRTAEVEETAVQKAARLFLVSLRPDNNDEAVERWNEAYALARREKDLGVQYFLGRSALRLGYLAGAVQAYEGLFKEPEWVERASEEIWMEYFTVSLATGSFEQAHERVVAATERFPESLALVNNRLYLELVAELDWAEAYARFAALAPAPEEIRDVNGTGSTWVLSTLRREQPREALAQLEAIEAANPDQPVSDSTKIVKTLVLAANQRYDEAIALSREIDRARVLPAEWALLGNLRLE